VTKGKKEKKLYRVEEHHVALSSGYACCPIVTMSRKDEYVIRNGIGNKVVLNTEEFNALRQAFQDGVL